MTLDPADRGRVSRRLLELSEEFRGQPDGLVQTWETFKKAKTTHKRVRARTLLKAPTRDPNDETRKYTTDDREAWVETRVDVMDAEDAMDVAEAAHKWHVESVWARNKELEAIRTMAADARAEMNM